MAFDGIVVANLVHELKEQLKDGRILGMDRKKKEEQQRKER